MSSLPLLLLQAAVILAACRLLTPVVARLGQPAVMAEMLAGLLLGPSCLGWLVPQLSVHLFPASSIPTLNFVSQAGLIVFMFLIGCRIDMAHLTGTGRAVIITSVVSVVTPFALGAILATILWEVHAPAGVPRTPFALFMGTAMSITAFPVLVRILDDHELLATTLGTFAVACAAFNDVVGWVILGAVTALTRAGTPSDTALSLLGLAVYAVVMVVVARPALKALLQRRGDSKTGILEAMAVLVVVFVSAYVTDWLGIHALFGAFFSGALMPRSNDAPRAVAHSVEPAVATWLLPLFFASSGLRTALPLIDSPSLWADAALILLVAVLGKGLGSGLAAWATGLGRKDAAAMGVLLNTRGLVELVVLNIGLDLGLLSPALFSMMVLMTLATTFATSPLLSLLGYRRRSATPRRMS